MSVSATVVDVVVIGSGASGLSAAATAAESGAKVLVFEKQRSLGGCSNFFEGTFAVESDMQRLRYIMYSRDDAFRNIMEYSHWRANARLVRAIVDESAATIGWLLQRGVEFSEVSINMPDAPRTYHIVKGAGASVVRALATKTKENRGIIMPSCPVKEILKEGGRVSGVVAEQDGEEIEVVAKAVHIACGGYANNKEWIRKYSGFDLGVNLLPVGNVGKNGDGIKMAWDAGAAEAGIGPCELFRVGPVGPDFQMKGQLEFAAVQPDLWVDPTGQRFCDEGIAFYDTSIGNANARHKEGYTFTIFDDSIKRRLLEHGVDRNVAWENMPGARPVNFDQEFNAALARGGSDVFAADSIEALATQIGVEPATLKNTVEEYNGFCHKGHDDLFAKNPRYLRPLIGPRYYAIKARTVLLGTMGGIKINHRAEVVDKDNKAIPGLYAGGYDAGGMYGDSYPIECSSGLSSCFALTSGRIAGKNMLEYLGIRDRQK
jgi:fumarate reductase flavoprotein subunit